MNGSIGDQMAMWSYVGYGAAFVVGLAVHVGWLVAALTSVRRASRRASTLMVTAVVLQMLVGLASPLITAALGVAANRSGGPSMYAATLAAWSVVGSILGAGTAALLIAGVVRLARDRKDDVRDPDPSMLRE